MSKFKVNDIAYINDNGWTQVQIIRVQGNYYHVRRLDRPSAFGASEHRLLTEDEYHLIASEQETYYRRPDLH